MISLAFAAVGTACAGTEDMVAEETSPSATASSSSSSASSGGGQNGEGGFSPGEPDKVELVYGHSPTALYKLDPEDNSVTLVGDFVGTTSDMIDVALDKDSNMFGTTFDGLYAVDRSTAKCTLIASGNYPNSLSFVPAGSVDPTEEALVGYEEDVYVRIDRKTGDITAIGAITGYTSSGDIVAVGEGSSAYLTVHDVGGTQCQDCIVQVVPKTGELLKNFGPVGYKNIYGLAFWGGSAYGFTQDGLLVQIAFGADSVTATPIPMPNTPAELKFNGAGSTTAAPSTTPE